MHPEMQNASPKLPRMYYVWLISLQAWVTLEANMHPAMQLTTQDTNIIP